MKLAFSTLGCPDWDLQTIAAAVERYGFAGVELRAVAGELDLLGRPEFQPGAVETTRRWLTEKSIDICCVDTSCRFDSPDANERSAQVEIAVKHTELAAALGSSLIRVFPDTIREGSTREQTRDNIAECLRAAALRAAGGVKIGLETHGDFARASTAAETVTLAEHTNVVLIWDIANSVAAGDSIKTAATNVAPFLAHVHLRDARPNAGQPHWLPVLAGTGEISFQEAMNALGRLNYDGYISFEWEKYWHPEIEEPEVAFPNFVAAMKEATTTAQIS